MSLASCVEAIPFLWLVMSQMAASHLRSPIFVSSKMVPTLMENRLPQSSPAHLWVFLSAKV